MKIKARKPKKVVRYAVVGLGHIAQVAVLPAFANARCNSRLTALVTGDAKKAKKLAARYDVEHVASYQGYDELLASGEIDAVYIALPNDRHCDFTVRAAQAKVHILCEKPLAVTAAECEQMIEAARRHGVQLMTAYRLHFEQGTLTAIDAALSGKIGEPRVFNSHFTFMVDQGNVRVEEARGGGPLFDVGVYCINAARYLYRAEPLEVLAAGFNGGHPKFAEIHEALSAIMRFSGDRVATFTCGFGTIDSDWFELLGTKGSLRLEPAYGYLGARDLEVKIGERTKGRRFPERDHFGAQLLYFSQCILENREPGPSGVEGLADVRVIEAIHESARTGRPVTLPRFDKSVRPTMAQHIRRPPVKKPRLVRAESTAGDR